MKSKYFSERSLNDTGKEAIVLLAGFPVKKLDILANWFEQLQSSPNLDLYSMQTLGKEIQEPPVNLRKIVRTVFTILSQMGKNKDTPEGIVEDLVTLKVLPGRSESLLGFLNRLAPKMEALYRVSKKEMATFGGASGLSAFSVGIALKPVFDSEFVYGRDSLADYNPGIADYATVAQISMTRNDCSQEFSFTLSMDDLNKFVASLLAIQKQMLVANENSKKLFTK